MVLLVVDGVTGILKLPMLTPRNTFVLLLSYCVANRKYALHLQCIFGILSIRGTKWQYFAKVNHRRIGLIKFNERKGNNMKKYIRILIIMISLFAGIFSNVVNAETSIVAFGNCGTEGDGSNVTWTLYSDGTFVVRGEGDMKHHMWGDSPWYDYLLSIREIIIEEGVTSISSYAFAKCQRLSSVKISDSVTTIYEGAFNGCDTLTSINIPDSVTKIGHDAFLGCHDLAEISLSKNITVINSSTFEGCWELRRLVIPAGVTTINERAFWECNKLQTIIFQGDVPTWSMGYGIPYATFYYNPMASGWTTPTWNDRPTYPCAHGWADKNEIVSGDDNDTKTTSVFCVCGYELKHIEVKGETIFCRLHQGKQTVV